MRLLGTVLLVLGAIGVVVGILAAMARTLRSVGIAFDFVASSVAGPLVGGAVLLLAGALVRRFYPPTP